MNAALHADDIPAVEPTALTSVPPENVGQLVFGTDPSTVWFGRPGLSIGSGGRISSDAGPEVVEPGLGPGSARNSRDGTTSSRPAPRARRVRLPHRARGRGDAGGGHRGRLRGRPTVRSDVGAPHGAGRLFSPASRSTPPMVPAHDNGRLRGIPAPRSGVAGWLDRLARVPLSIHQLLFRLGVASVFLKAGAVKVGSWEATLTLFRDEYRVPVLSPGTAAAAMATTFELVCPAMLILGLGTRLATLPSRDARDYPALRVSERLVRASRMGVRPLLPPHARPGAIALDHLIARACMVVALNRRRARSLDSALDHDHP